MANTSVTVSESVTELVVNNPDALSVDITENVTTVSVNNLAIPTQSVNASNVSFSPYGTISATNVQEALQQVADKIYKASSAPSGGYLSEGDFWYNTSTDDLFIYREVSTGVYNWVPILFSETDSDTIDGGAF